MRKHVYVIGHGSPSHESLVSSHESTFNVCVRITSVPLVNPFLSRAKHVLGRGPNKVLGRGPNKVLGRGPNKVFEKNISNA